MSSKALTSLQAVQKHIKCRLAAGFVPVIQKTPADSRLQCSYTGCALKVITTKFRIVMDHKDRLDGDSNYMANETRITETQSKDLKKADAKILQGLGPDGEEFFCSDCFWASMSSRSKKWRTMKCPLMEIILFVKPEMRSHIDDDDGSSNLPQEAAVALATYQGYMLMEWCKGACQQTDVLLPRHLKESELIFGSDGQSCFLDKAIRDIAKPIVHHSSNEGMLLADLEKETLFETMERALKNSSDATQASNVSLPAKLPTIQAVQSGVKPFAGLATRVPMGHATGRYILSSSLKTFIERAYPRGSNELDLKIFSTLPRPSKNEIRMGTKGAAEASGKRTTAEQKETSEKGGDPANGIEAIVAQTSNEDKQKSAPSSHDNGEPASKVVEDKGKARHLELKRKAEELLEGKRQTKRLQDSNGIGSKDSTAKDLQPTLPLYSALTQEGKMRIREWINNVETPSLEKK